MAQGALTAGTTVPRKRALFGLLDADGWAWATAKAIAWLTFIILILGYIPDRAYYLTVSRTVDLGVLAWSPINLCPPENQTLPCPAPVGAIVPWAASPTQLDLPAARTDGNVVQIGTRLLYIGGSDGTTAQSTVYVAQTVGTGNFDAWAPGPPLPEPRTDAAVAFVAGSVYVMGGKGADGAPTTTTFVLTPDGTTGELGDWKKAPDNLTLPEARAGAAAVATADGMLLVGGSNASGPVATTYKSLFDKVGVLQKWAEEKALDVPQTDATAAIVGDYLWLYGGSDATGPVALVQRGTIAKPAAAGLPANPEAGKVSDWVSDPVWNLPAPALERRELGGQRGDVRRRRHRRHRAPQRGLLGDAVQRRHDRRVEAPRGQRPAGPGPGRRPGRLRPRRDHRRRHDRRRRRQEQHPREHRPAGPVLPARPGRRDGAGPHDPG